MSVCIVIQQEGRTIGATNYSGGTGHDHRILGANELTEFWGVVNLIERMKTVPLQINGGGQLIVSGSLESKSFLILTGREDYNRDLVFLDALFAYFAKKGLTVAKYESKGEVAMRRLNAFVPKHYPSRLRNLLKFLQCIFLPQYWFCLSERHRARVRSVEYKTQSIRELLRLLGPDKEFVFLTRSVSARVITKIAGEFNIKRIVCLGYPFQHPAEGPSADRYSHLEGLETPTLIMQGERDIYGGREILEKYRFGSNTIVEMIDCDHDFNINADTLSDLLKRVEQFISGPQKDEKGWSATSRFRVSES